VVYANVNDRQAKSDLFRRIWQEYKVASFEDPLVAPAVTAIRGKKVSKLISAAKLAISSQAVYSAS
jgi:hypothetical protein